MSNTTSPSDDQGVVRFSVSLPAALARDLDAMAQQAGHGNRSSLIADMIRDWLVERRRHDGDYTIAGTITLVYDHHRGGVQESLTTIQHDHPGIIISTMHVHMDHHHCLEVLAVKGTARDVQQIADSLITVKGVKHGQLTVTTTGKDMH